VRRFSDRQSLQTLTDLNVTPLLDLAFVLLIIFMITTPLIENSLDLVVPTSSTAKSEVNAADVQMVAINRDATLKLNDTPVTAAELESQLTALHSANPNIAVVVRPDKDLAIQRFVAVMDILQRVSITKVGVMTRPEDAPAAP
jgi:biopolymer transport protein ExbD